MDKYNDQPFASNISKNTMSVTDLDIPEQYSVGATALDCSVMLTFKPLDNKEQRFENSTYNLYGYAFGQRLILDNKIYTLRYEHLRANVHNRNTNGKVFLINRIYYCAAMKRITYSTSFITNNGFTISSKHQLQLNSNH